VLRPGDLAVVGSAENGLGFSSDISQTLAPLASALGLDILTLARGCSPVNCLRERAHAAEPALLCIKEDPGRWLGSARGCWSQALGDFQHATVLLVTPDGQGHLSGAAAARAALLKSTGVPLLGLIQSRGPWDGQARREDGLPWLGWLTSEPETVSSVAAALQIRWRLILER